MSTWSMHALQDGPGQGSWAYNLAERLLPGTQGNSHAADAGCTGMQQDNFENLPSAHFTPGQPLSLPQCASEQVLSASAFRTYPPRVSNVPLT